MVDRKLNRLWSIEFADIHSGSKNPPTRRASRTCLGSSTTTIVAHSTRRWRSPTCIARPASMPRSERPATHDNALVDTIKGPWKTELIKAQDPGGRLTRSRGRPRMCRLAGSTGTAVICRQSSGRPSIAGRRRWMVEGPPLLVTPFFGFAQTGALSLNAAQSIGESAPLFRPTSPWAARVSLGRRIGATLLRRPSGSTWPARRSAGLERTLTMAADEAGTCRRGSGPHPRGVDRCGRCTACRRRELTCHMTDSSGAAFAHKLFRRRRCPRISARGRLRQR
ncbi:hypothetical protein M2280_005948 [Prescottella agglutinans]|uniref:Uncharacterized protein n=1 Tax=Prescottella agglutinans TaxID=1644129 RepID=A0ABT6MK36_9NOCA|nr:hypothetical protein [Prescottella agglutinans]